MYSRNRSERDRRSVRLPGYDYRQAAAYFVTICTRDRAWLFGEVVRGTVRLSEAGRVAAREWCALPDRFPRVALDEWVIMPNHLHGIIALTGSQPLVGVALAIWRARHPMAPGRARRGPGVTSGSLGAIVGAFKSTSALRINRLRSTAGHPVWQRGYYESVIGTDAGLAAVRRYIADNPFRWA